MLLHLYLMFDSNNTAVIKSITCPITGIVMRDPVVGKDGQTYERSAIIHVLSIKPESPITHEPMQISDLEVNTSIRFICDKYHAGEFATDQRVKTSQEPSLINSEYSGWHQIHGSGVTTNSIEISTLSSYNSEFARAPCFHGSSLIILATGEKIQIQNLVKGDKVQTLSDPYNMQSKTTEATVVCILKTLTHGQAPLVTLGSGLRITPWHPVLVDNEWKFPINIGRIVTQTCKYIYSILLDNGHTCCINDVWCIGLGHSYNKGIIKHDYFGTSAIVKDMQSLPGWNRGLIILDSHYSILRDPHSQLIISICGKGKQPMYKSIVQGQLIPNMQRVML